MKKKIYSVTDVTRDIRIMLEINFESIWVEGEISNYTMSSAGHAYFSLKDDNSVLNCVLFKGNAARLRFLMEDGMHILCSGRISVYDKRGQYQLYVNVAEPVGRGALQLAFEQLKEKLRKEGIFDPEHKKPIPFLPVCIGVVTSPHGAAVRDIFKVLRRRFSNVEIILRPVKVQGGEAKFEISRAIEELNEFNEYVKKHPGTGRHTIDVMIVGRGGGSLEDLWPFNEEIVARTVFSSDIPVISAVGHEIDYTISDFAADMRAPTPSAAAELAVPVKDELKRVIDKYMNRTHVSMLKKTERLDNDINRLKQNYVLREPMNVLRQMEQRINDLADAVTGHIKHFMEISSSDLNMLRGQLKALSPSAVLKRGYSITLNKGKAIKNLNDIEKGDILETRVSGGSVISAVREKTWNKE